MSKKQQLKLFKDSPMAYGGDLLKTRKGRASGRPLDTKSSMHLVLRSSLAKGQWSFRYGNNLKIVRTIIEKFAYKYGIKIISLANVGNHIHMQIKLSNRFAYKMFIKAITSAIAMAITGRNRWTKHAGTIGTSNIDQKGSLNEAQISALNKDKLKFWDLRPYTRVIIGWRSLLKLADYIRVNQIEGWGFKRSQAKDMLYVEKWLRSTA